MSQTTNTATATATPVRLFPNDFTNITDREEQKRKREEEARLLAVAAERERNRTKCEKDLREEIERLKQHLAGLEVDKKNVESKLQQETTRANKLEGERNQLQNEKLDPKNNLDPGYHGKLVMIVNIGGRRAIESCDSGKANEEAWVYDWSWDRPNQKLQLFKADPNNKKSPWRIKCVSNGKWLLAVGYSLREVPSFYAPENMDSRTWDHYYIGSAKAGEYVFESIHSKMVLDQCDTSRGGSGGKTLYQYDRLENSHQLWNIIRMEPDVA